jgi:hypothetical protein
MSHIAPATPATQNRLRVVRSALSSAPPVEEPKKTILLDDWHVARSRARGLPRRERKLFSSLLDSVETGWIHVRKLQRLHDELRPTASGTPACVLDFIDDHVCDLFRTVAFQVALFVPDCGGGLAGIPDFDNTDGDADQFGSFVAILLSAVCDPQVPAELATAVRLSTEPLLTWYRDLEPALKRAADAVQGT